MTTRHELPNHLDTVNKPFLGLTLRQFFALVLAAALGVTLVGHLPASLPLATRLGVGALLCALLVALTLIRPAGKTLWVWGRIVLVYAGLARVTVWHREGE